MSHEHGQASPHAAGDLSKKRFAAASSGWVGAWRKAAVVGYVGLALSIVGAFREPTRFGASYLFAFWGFLSIAIGALFFVVVQHLTKAQWSVTVRRSSEFLMAGLPVFVILVIPLLATTGRIYPWDGAPREPEAVQVGAFGSSADEGAREPFALRSANQSIGKELEHATREEDAKVRAGRAPYLNRPFFAVRAVLFLLIWSWLARRYFRWSVQQDETRAIDNGLRAERFAPMAMILFALSVSFAGFDWLMTLEPKWYSTMFGVYTFAGCTVSHAAAIVLLTLVLRRSGLTNGVFNVEHFHDLGKFLFGFVCFWAYIAYAQFFLMWYANIPEELVFFHRRWTDHGGSWQGVTLALATLHFAVPFWLLLSRNAKRNLRVLAAGAVLVACMHFVDVYWLVLPNFGAFSPHWLDVSCLVGVGGMYATAVLRAIEMHSLVPVGDPRIRRVLAYDNG